MELVAADYRTGRGRRMATVTHACTLEYVAEMLSEDAGRRCWAKSLTFSGPASIDNLTYRSIISVYDGTDETSSALTDHAIDELKVMLWDARITTGTWNDFADCFVDGGELVDRIKAYSEG